MALLNWEPQGGEVRLLFDPVERSRYEAGEPSAYDQWAWPAGLITGRDQRGSRCFPEVAARAHFEQQGYKVLISAPKYPNDLGFLLFHFRGMRRRSPPHPAFVRMQEHFRGIDLHQLAEDARLEKRSACGKRGGGGDPDLFVFQPNTRERFFVEAKDQDGLNCNQLVCFPMIEQRLNCAVRVVRVVPRDA